MWLVCVLVCVSAWAGGARGAGGAHCRAGSACRPVGPQTSAALNNEAQFTLGTGTAAEDIVITFSEGQHVEVMCKKTLNALDSPDLPQFTEQLCVPFVTINGCPLPRTRSLVDALAALNVSLVIGDVHGNLSLTSLPGSPPLADTHLAGLEGLRALHLSAVGVRPPPAPRPGFLAPLRSLRSLVLLSVRLPPDELLTAPDSLQLLSLRNSGVERLPDKLFQLPIRQLEVAEDKLVTFPIPSSLKSLSLWSRNNTIPVEGTAELQKLTLKRSSMANLAPLARCGELRRLHLMFPAVQELPDSWVALCPRLEYLHVEYAKKLKRLPPGLLINATELVQLKFMHGVLETLPEELLGYATKLQELDLRSNKLKTIPSEAFVTSATLRTLTLLHNQLQATAAAALAPLLHLSYLNLARNPALGDLCRGTNEYSSFMNLTNLRYLSLAKTNISCICRDWRDNMTLLTTLDLASTKVSKLTFSDLRYTREVDRAEVYLKGAPVSSVQLTQEDYVRSTRLAEGHGASVLLNSQLACDCNMYWTRLALPNLFVLKQNKLECAQLGQPLSQLDPREMQCPTNCSGAGLPAACSCSRQPYNESGPQWLVTANCSGVSRGAVPTLRPIENRYYRLLLQGNGISTLRPANVTPAIVELDLRNNSIERVDTETAEALSGASHLKLWLAENPVDCTCAGDALLQALHGSGAEVLDLPQAACGSDLGPLADALKRPPCPARLPLALWLAVALAAILTTAAVFLAYFASPQRRLLLKALLYRWGLLRHPAEVDESCEFDAFVMSAAEDEAVAMQIARRLEGEPAPYRLCLNERDFVAGALISAQMEAAVQRSRRTVALVSRHFLTSECLSVALREAQARALREAAPRLVLVLLEEPAALPLGEELRQYIKAYTYVPWNHALFWDKLKMALLPPTPRVLLASPPVSVAKPIPTDSSDSSVSSSASSASIASVSSSIPMPPPSLVVTPGPTWISNRSTTTTARDRLRCLPPVSVSHHPHFSIAVAT